MGTKPFLNAAPNSKLGQQAAENAQDGGAGEERTHEGVVLSGTTVARGDFWEQVRVLTESAKEFSEPQARTRGMESC